MKLKWEVAPVPTGRYRSFEERGWPSASYRNGDEDAAARIECADEYVPANAKSGKHLPLHLHVAHWVNPDERGEGAAFKWRKVIQIFETLPEAKAAAQSILDDRPHFWPEGVK